LVFSFLGYQTQEIVINNRTIINIQLKTEATLIDDVVVTALGIKRDKKSLGYSVQEVKGEELQRNKEVSVINTLSGKVAGLQVSATTGGAASSSRVVLRGNNSFNSNQALIVVDGVPIENSTTSSSEGEWGGKDYGNGISDINPDDIESISVLKGASASALYGSRAANGVILITTKKGTKKKGVSVQFRTSTTLDFAYIHKKFQNKYGAGSNGKFETHWKVDSNGTPKYFSDQANYYSSWGPEMNGQEIIDWDGGKRSFSPQEDNYKNYFQTGYTINNSLSIGGGKGKNTFRFTAADLRNRDIIPGAKVKRTNLGLNTQLTLFKKINISAYLSYVNQRADNRPGLSDDHTNAARNYILMPRHISSESLKNHTMNKSGEEQTWYSAWNWQSNPYWNELYELSYDKKNRGFGNISATYKHNDNLSFLLRHAEDYSSHYFDNITAFNGMISSTGGYSNNTINRWQYNTDFLMTYKKELHKDLSITGNIGGNAFYEHFDENYQQTEGGLSTPYEYTIENSASIPKTIHQFREKAINSLYAFGQIDYKHFIFFDITGRNDWSSTLPENNNSYFYPSYSMGFVFTELIKETSKFRKYLPYGKIRASWAKVGNDTDPYQLDLTYYIDDNNIYGEYARVSSQIPPANLKPEELVSKEIGTDLRFLKNRIGVDFTWYQTNCYNQIVRLDVSSASGFPRALINAGNIENKGVELQLKLDVIKKKNFNWQSTINYTKNKSEVIELNDNAANLQVLNHWNLSIEARPGHPYGDIVGYGIKKDQNGNKLINENGMYIRSDSTVVLGNVNPDFAMSWSNTFSYKRLSLSFMIDARFGGEMFSGTNMYGNGYAGNFEESLEGRDEWYASEAAREKAGVSSNNWTPTGGMQAEGVYADGTIIDGKDVSGQSNTTFVNPEDYWQQFSEWTHEIHEPFVYDASFIKLRELSISYELPVELTKKLKMESLTFSLIARNIWLIYSNTPNVDPESFHTNGNGQGYELYAYPTRRSFGASLTLKF
jgi:TonB-linked SusC/RagA family outer membrane protein